MPKSKQIVPKRVENFVQNQINLKYIAKYFLNIYQSGGISPNLDTLMPLAIAWHFINANSCLISQN